ncbi:14489_t:CDS:1, partial [Rhizophagus irregularis]
KNVKKRVSSELSDDEIDEIYSNIYFRYRKTSEFYCPCASKEVKKSVAYRLISSAKVIQWA